MHNQEVTATHKDDSSEEFTWTDDSKQSLADWKKARGKDYTFTELEDNPEVAKRTALKNNLNRLDDPDPMIAQGATNELLKHLFKDLDGE